MTELEEKQAGCPYCRLGRPIKDNSCSIIAIEQNANILWFNSDKFVGEDEGDIVSINYCPMCGRKLGEDE